MSKICMAAINDNDKTLNARRLQERFPEIPEAVIAQILSQHAHNMEKCLMMLSQESEKYLYGENSDGPDSSPPVMTPLSINIPDRPVTIGAPTPGSITNELRRDKHTPVDDYKTQLLNHQQQRLDRLLKELHTEEQKLFDLKLVVGNKNEELVNKKFRVAGNPSKSDVDHLEEETQVLREEIDEMTHEIDRIKSLPMPLKKSESFPRPTPANWTNNRPGPVNGPHGPRPPWFTQSPGCPRPPWLMGQGTHSPERDKSLEGSGWILVPPNQQPSPSDIPSTSQNDTEEMWQCKHCTLVNHGALNHCELCERPRS